MPIYFKLIATLGLIAIFMLWGYNLISSIAALKSFNRRNGTKFYNYYEIKSYVKDKKDDQLQQEFEELTKLRNKQLIMWIGALISYVVLIFIAKILSTVFK